MLVYQSQANPDMGSITPCYHTLGSRAAHVMKITGDESEENLIIEYVFNRFPVMVILYRQIVRPFRGGEPLF